MLTPLLKAAYYVEHGFDKVRWSYLRKYNRIGPLLLMGYRGFGDRKEAYVSGRLIEDRNIRPAREQDNKWHNLRAMYKRFESNEIPGARIQAEFYGQHLESTTDAEGYFHFQLPVPTDIDTEQTEHPVQFRLLDKIGNNKGPVQASSFIHIPQQKADFGVISDIDDTVLQTSATSFVRMMQKTFLYNAKTRLPFKGVAAFYRALHEGAEIDKIKNPLYYVSSSPWNLYDMLEDFLEIQQIPAGPLMLRDLGLKAETLFQSSHKEHKLKEIEKIFSCTGDLRFILIGDSGQKDPEIYLEVIKHYPKRVLAAYIRDVSEAGRDKEVIKIIDEAESLGAQMLLVKDTEAAARHAIGQGYIQASELPEVKKEKQKDEQA
ncbi:App1 family protein [Nafulsella turpanensis]|uniref:App1 family protein n=1 Tax=Nafulsella turpanensis TaxID=1265690 RepID=UPI00034B37F1|nr:phosphatase domain-containing protein [Nafulsella turpanensis]